jgi:hypothetical protein
VHFLSVIYVIYINQKRKSSNYRIYKFIKKKKYKKNKKEIQFTQTFDVTKKVKHERVKNCRIYISKIKLKTERKTQVEVNFVCGRLVP